MTTDDASTADGAWLSTGDLARTAGVSVRTLHHYDALDLLRPAHVDDRTGHRRYAPRQLRDLRRVVMLKELGLSLQEVREALAADPSDAELRDLLLVRRGDLERQQAEVRHRLLQLDARLRLLDADAAGAVVTREVPAVRVAASTAVLLHDAAHGRHVEDLFVRASRLVDDAGGSRTTPVGRFVPRPDGSVRVVAGFETVREVPGLDLVELPAARVATVVHHGPMDGIGRTTAVLDAWAAERAVDPSATARRWLFLEADGEHQGDWVVEVQLELDASPTTLPPV
ncbi:MerR family transcriptional regulator [Cellulomonas sp. JZ18]|uniref:MerR family transcriptional regulator n=1 Tax=Cellulomonas sp. JZ18 TaxID=2654191 RepID=UPI0018AFA5B1|nr:MerR family transcriptional regulator [Cellulomonas sp. JZ18]